MISTQRKSYASKLTIFYALHSIAIFAAFLAYFYFRHPELLDFAQWGGAVGIAIWTAANNSKLTEAIGLRVFESYKRKCIRSFGKFVAISAVLTIAVIFGGCVMFRDLFSRWSYVTSIKEMTMSEGNEAIPYATAPELAHAYQLYPHRREVPFILTRMSRLLAFDDEVENFNVFIRRFSQDIDIIDICERYKNKEDLDGYTGAIDPVVFLSRILIESAPSADTLTRAIQLLDKYRANDPTAALHKILYEHELLELDKVMTPIEKKVELLKLKGRIDTVLKATTQLTSPRDHLQIVTDHVFQEVLDHYAQIEIQTALNEDDYAIARVKVPKLYSRVLVVRQQIARASDVPWLSGPGKFSIYYFFQHYLGRESGVSRELMKMVSSVPGLDEALKTMLFNAEAFRDYRTMKTWDIGTPQSAEYAGTEMHRKLVGWLKFGW